MRNWQSVTTRLVTVDQGERLAEDLSEYSVVADGANAKNGATSYHVR